MQKAIIVTDAASLTELNAALATDEYAVSQISAGPNGSWLVIIDDEAVIDPFADMEMEDEDMEFDEEDA
ncbi:MAG: hypothetical protein DHS20C10_11650 [marine bacterium B5-7]|nr:MAG: hypothetical protein DHS20C10_11650 [marine bacterium B5-7]